VSSRRLALVALVALVAGVGAAAAGVFLVGGDEGSAPRSAATGTGEPLSGPEVRLTGTDVATGAHVSLGKLEGRPVVVTVWASWCKACSGQAEPLRRFAAASARASILTVDTQEDAEAARAFLAEHGLGIPTIADEDGHIAAKLGVRELPTTIFLTGDHRVASMWEGPAGLSRFKAGLAAARSG
jgi:cytochrome c biogenesis protein CcmG/thiol:disulfide interchange protein DsbE